MMRPWLYSTLYRLGVAPWDSQLRPELVELVDDGRIPLPRSGSAVDLGCGTGREAVYLAQRGYRVTGVDYTKVAVRRARRRAAEAGVADRCAFVHGDVTSPDLAGRYDLLLDFGTLDDLDAAGRQAMAGTVHRLSGPGSLFVFWCFYAHPDELPEARWSGASKMLAPIVPGEEKELFGDAFDIERLPTPPPPEHSACFLMTRR
jgi:SAM-dependent methyltransferase